MIPIPPLDGSKIIYGLLPDSLYEWCMRNEQLLSLLIFLLLFSGVLNAPLLQLRNTVWNALMDIAIAIVF